MEKEVKSVMLNNVFVEEKLNELRYQMNYLCYDREILDKFGGIWKAFYELEETLTRTESDGEKPPYKAVVDWIQEGWDESKEESLIEAVHTALNDRDMTGEITEAFENYVEFVKNRK